MTYIELRCHSAFSFGDGASTPEALIERAAAYGYPALGLTDTADLGGIIRFALEADRAGIRPIIGSELMVDGHPAAFLAMTEEGYHNLAALVTHARLGAPTSVAQARSRSGSHPGTPRPRGRPHLTWSELADHSAGLFALTGPATGELPHLIRSHRPEEATYQLGRWRDLFGERLAVEVQYHHSSGTEEALARALIELAEWSRTPWVVTNDPRYLDNSSRLVHEMLTAHRAGLDLDGAARAGLLLPNGEWRLRPPAEMERVWRGREVGLEESRRIALACDFDLNWLRAPLPHFPVPRGHDDDSFLRELTLAGAHERWGELNARQEAQLEHELGVIRRLGFAGFFLVMWDAVRFARSRGILCQGRGSAANSVVAYLLGITAVDPVEHGLLFERFLSESRTDGSTEAPDIDVDFEMHRREEVLDYMYRTWGREHAAITAVTQVYHASTALQDAMRALGYPAELAAALSKRLRRYHAAEGADLLESELADRHGLDLSRPRGRALLAAMRAMDDLPRLRSTHPGGFVISSAPLGNHMPIEQTTMGRTILQFDKDDLDAAGVPKFDFLGLGGLTAIRLAFDSIEERTGERLEVYRLPQDDPRTYEMIARGDVVGTFQIESRAQVQSLLKTEPERLYDLVVQVALIRPGPIQARFVRPYTRRRRGLEPVTYAHPDLEPILRRTQGVPIFQEQAMSIAMTLGGFTAAEADELRRTMGHQKKLPRLQAALQRLYTRMTARGISAETAGEIVEDLLSFANYGFPESHAWSFALIAYATAWLKAHYPADFFMALLNAWPMGFYPPSTLVHTARRDGVEVRPPCLRDGAWECTLEPRATSSSTTGLESGGDTMDPNRAESDRPLPPDTDGHPALRIGWRFIDGLSERTREALQTAGAEAPFTSVADIVSRAGLSSADALQLARAGAFEAFEPGRRRAAWEALRGIGDYLPLAPTRTLPFRPQELKGPELVFLDYLATGISTDGHPMEYLRERLAEAGVIGSRGLESLRDGERCLVAGLVVARQHPATSRGTVFILLEDEWGFINLIVPPQLYLENREIINYSAFLLVEGEFQREGRVLNLVGRRFRRLRSRPIAFRSRDFR